MRNSLSFTASLVILIHFGHSLSFKLTDNVDQTKGLIVDMMSSDFNNRTGNMILTLLNMDQTLGVGGLEGAKIRTKRQGAGKFTDAAKMSQTKAGRLYGQMLKNLWAPSYVGGAHPFHHEVPKAIVTLFRQKVLDYFFPDVGEPDKTQ